VAVGGWGANVATDFDVIVVGAGPSGTSAAYELKRRGYKVLLTDRRRLLHAKPCGGGLSTKTLKLLPWSVGSVVERVVAILGMGVHGSRNRQFAVFEADGHVCAFTVRKQFDRFNLEKTIESGVEFGEGRLGQFDSRIDGVRATIDHKAWSTRYLIGADGANSTVRRLLGVADWFHRGFAVEGLVDYGTIGREPGTEFIFGYVKNGYGWLFPKDDHVNVGIYTWDGTVNVTKERLRAYARERIGTDRIEHIVGFPIGFGGGNYIPNHERILLVGDAGGFAEPLLGEGIHNALKSGQAAASAIAAYDSGSASSLRAAYNKALNPLYKDLARCEQLKRFFYSNLEGAGFRTLKLPVIKNALMRGFAAGKTMYELTNMFFLSPCFRPLMPAGLHEFVCRPKQATASGSRLEAPA
jgi:geranylgeranyl reductase family protein